MNVTINNPVEVSIEIKAKTNELYGTHRAALLCGVDGYNLIISGIDNNDNEFKFDFDICEYNITYNSYDNKSIEKINSISISDDTINIIFMDNRKQLGNIRFKVRGNNL